VFSGNYYRLSREDRKITDTPKWRKSKYRCNVRYVTPSSVRSAASDAFVVMASSDRSKVKRRPFVVRRSSGEAEIASLKGQSVSSPRPDYIDDDRERPGISVLREVSDWQFQLEYTREGRAKTRLSPVVDADRFSMRSRGRWFLRRSLSKSLALGSPGRKR